MDPHQPPTRSLLAHLNLALFFMLMLYVVWAVSKLLFPFGPSTSGPYYPSTIKNIVIRNGDTFTRLPPTYATCFGDGELTCTSRLTGKQIRVSFYFNQGTWFCAGTYGGEKISCQALYNSNNSGEPSISLNASELGLDAGQLNALSTVASIAPYPFMRWAWPMLLLFYAVAFWQRFQQRRQPADSEPSADHDSLVKTAI